MKRKKHLIVLQEVRTKKVKVVLFCLLVNTCLLKSQTITLNIFDKVVSDYIYKKFPYKAVDTIYIYDSVVKHISYCTTQNSDYKFLEKFISKKKLCRTANTEHNIDSIFEKISFISKKVNEKLFYIEKETLFTFFKPISIDNYVIISLKINNSSVIVFLYKKNNGNLKLIKYKEYSGF